MAALWSVLRPYHAAATAQSDQLLYSYREFLSEEVKRKWEWKRRTEQERGFWDAVVTFAMGALALTNEQTWLSYVAAAFRNPSSVVMRVFAGLRMGCCPSLGGTVNAGACRADDVNSVAAVCGVTLIWEALVPAAVAWAIAVPLYFVLTSYELSFRGLLLNPIMVGLVLMLPLKFYPGMPVRWV